MYSVLSAVTWRPMPAAARYRLCSRNSAWAGVFARSAMSSALFASVIVCAEYLLLLSFASLKPLSFILSSTSLDKMKDNGFKLANKHRKSFWFFQSIFSILGSMQLRRRALYILTAMDVRVIAR